MKNLTDRRKRLEQSYVEALGVGCDVQKIYDTGMQAAALLIDNIADRAEWNEAEHRRLTRAALSKGERPPAPVSLVGELETIRRIIDGLQSPSLAGFRKADPNAGAREICRILQLARKEHGEPREKAEQPEKEAGAGVMPEEIKDDGAGVKTSQITTPGEGSYTASTDFHRRNLVRDVRRGSG